MTINQSAWTGMMPVDDTALYVSDTGGPRRPVVYLNGAYADQSHWRRVIADLGSDYRHITYDERARGKSKRSADYSFEACIRDVDAVLEARGVDRPLLVGWSYGGVLAWHWADRNPDRVLGVVCVDAFPVGLTGEAGHERIRKLFRRWRLLFPIAARLGLAAEPGRYVIELRPPGVDKGSALTGLAGERAARSVLFCGDDLGDLPVQVGHLDVELDVLERAAHVGRDDVEDAARPRREARAGRLRHRLFVA